MSIKLRHEIKKNESIKKDKQKTTLTPKNYYITFKRLKKKYSIWETIENSLCKKKEHRAHSKKTQCHVSN